MIMTVIHHDFRKEVASTLKNLSEKEVEESLLRFLPLILNKLLWLISGDVLVDGKLFRFQRPAFETIANILYKLEQLEMSNLVEAFLKRQLRIPERTTTSTKTRKRSEEEERIENRYRAGAMAVARRTSTPGSVRRGGGGGTRSSGKRSGSLHRGSLTAQRPLKIGEFYEEITSRWMENLKDSKNKCLSSLAAAKTTVSFFSDLILESMKRKLYNDDHFRSPQTKTLFSGPFQEELKVTRSR